MKIFDLTHKLSNSTPVYPGTEKLNFTITSTVEKDTFKTTNLNMQSHAGTHLDCPAHIIKNGLCTDNMPIDKFYGKGIVIDVSRFEPDYEIKIKDIEKFKSKIEKSDYILLYSGRDKYWGKVNYFNNFPVLSPETAKFIVNSKIKGIGIDCISVDKIDSVDFKIHNILLKNNIIIVENLTALNQLIEKDFMFFAFPLKIKDGDGSPIRATAIVD